MNLHSLQHQINKMERQNGKMEFLKKPFWKLKLKSTVKEKIWGAGEKDVWTSKSKLELAQRASPKKCFFFKLWKAMESWTDGGWLNIYVQVIFKESYLLPPQTPFLLLLLHLLKKVVHVLRAAAAAD